MSTNSALAVTFDMPTLGRTPHLGELYSAASADFTGSYLFEGIDNDTDQINIEAGRTDLKLSMSDSLEEKSSVLDISASLSLEILGGLVKVEGSGRYLTDSKANSKTHSWAISLFLRKQEKRLLFEEKQVVGKRPPPDVIDDIIKQEQATHFVSSIVYGGSMVIELLSRRVELQKAESINGEFTVQLEKLKGLVDLTGKAKVKLDDDLKSLNDSFDLKARGDFSAMPLTDLQSILDSIPKAVKEIHDKPVPIMVTLQPIPGRKDPVYALEKAIIKDVLKVFAKLDDVRARLDALNDSAREASHKDIIPTLAKSIVAAIQGFKDKSSDYKSKLAKYLTAYYAGEKPPTEDRTNLVTDVRKLVDDNLKSVQDLEQVYRDFEDVEDIAKRTEFQSPTTGSQILTSFDDLADYIIDCKVGDKFALFLVPPPVHPIEVDSLSYIASLFRMGRSIFKEAKLESFVCYVEDDKARQRLQDCLKNHNSLFDIFDHTIAIRVERLHTSVSFEKQQFDDPNTALPPPFIVYDPNLETTSPGNFSYSVKTFDYENSFTIIIDMFNLNNVANWIVEISNINRQGYHFVKYNHDFHMQFKGTLQSEPSTIFKSKSNPTMGAHLLVFVQDVTGNGTWSFYIDGIQEGGTGSRRKYQGQVSKQFFIVRKGNDDQVYQGGNYYEDSVYLNRVRILNRALTKEEIGRLPRIASEPSLLQI